MKDYPSEIDTELAALISNISEMSTEVRNCTKIEVNLNTLYPWYITFRFFISGICTTFFFLLGFVGNFGSILFVRHSSLQAHDFAITLNCISLWDTVVLSSAMASYGFTAIAQYFQKEYEPFFVYWTVVALPVGSVGYTASAWFYGAITIQRWQAIVHPVFGNMGNLPRKITVWAKLSLWHKLKRYRVAIFVSIGAVVFKFSSFFEFVAIRCFDTDRQTFSAEVHPTPLRLSPWYQRYYRTVIDLVCTSVGPVLLIFVFTCAILKKLQLAYNNERFARFRRRSMVSARDGRKELFTTVILVALLVKFLCCRTLPCVIEIWESLGYSRSDISFQCLVEISNLLVLVGSSTNFLVYAFGRKILRSQRIFVRLRKKHRRRLSGFSAEEMVRLDFSWLDIWSQKERSTLGAQIAMDILVRDPELVLRLGLDSDDSGSWEFSDIVMTRGDQIAEFFLEIIQKLNTRETIGWDIDARERIQEMKELHEYHGVILTKESWRVVKKRIMRAARQHDSTFHDKQETARVWGKLVTFCEKEAER